MAIVVLDRDGVINVDSAQYIKSVDEWIPLPGSIEAIAALSQNGYRVYIATNQAGLARKLFTLEDLTQMHNKLRRLVEESGGEISGIMFCPHHPDELCRCRKPNIGLLEAIALEANEDLIGQAFVGDSLKDIQAAISMGCKPILVKTGNGRETLKLVDSEIPVFDNLASYVSSLGLSNIQI